MLGRPARPFVMGIVNATPDSFYAGSRGGLEHALTLVEEGADWLDVGGQSTRPGSESVSAEDELARVMPVIEGLAGKVKIPISIDTDKPAVAKAAREAGATILNDVRALRAPGMMEEAVKFEKVVLMHMLGDSPKTMQDEPQYDDVVSEVRQFLAERINAFKGLRRQLLVDPGIGFGKTLDHNLSLLKHLGELVGSSRVDLQACKLEYSIVSPK